MPRKKGNNYIIDETENIATIELNRKNGDNLWTTIDLEDLERVINFPYTWFAKYSTTIKDYYAAASVYHSELKRSRPLHLHQFILNTNSNHVDHKNHKPRDNRKSNLREISPSENYKNRDGKNSNNTSGYRNVSWDSRSEKWLVQLQINGKNKVLGKFEKDKLDEAGKFAEEMRRMYYGEYAGKS